MNPGGHFLHTTRPTSELCMAAQNKNMSGRARTQLEAREKHSVDKSLRPLTHGKLCLRLRSSQYHTSRGIAAGHVDKYTQHTQKHLRCTMVGPDSSYSPLEIHICWKVLKDDKMEPPIQTEYLRSGGATTLIFIVEGAKAVSSFVILSPIPSNIVVPPLSTTLAYKSFLMSTSHFMILWNVVPWMPDDSLPMKLGWKSTSGQRKRSLPSGSSYVFSLSELSVAAFISESKSMAMYDNFSFTSRTISRSAVVVKE